MLQAQITPECQWLPATKLSLADSPAPPRSVVAFAPRYLHSRSADGAADIWDVSAPKQVKLNVVHIVLGLTASA